MSRAQTTDEPLGREVWIVASVVVVGVIMPVGMALLAQTAGPSRVGRVMSVIGVPMLLGPVLGPVIGGVIVDSVSWRWIFYVNVPIAIFALGLAAKLLHRDHGRADAGKLDWVGLLLLSP